jgi:hypothetical protein
VVECQLCKPCADGEQQRLAENEDCSKLLAGEGRERALDIVPRLDFNVFERKAEAPGSDIEVRSEGV